MLAFASFSSLIVGLLSGLLGLSLCMPPPIGFNNSASSVPLLMAAVAFLVVGVMFEVIRIFLFNPNVSEKERMRVIKHLIDKLPDPSRMLKPV